MSRQLLLARAALCAVLLAVPAVGGAQTVYEYAYPYNTPDLNENHYIVLDTTGEPVRGWYWGTSDDFDSAREGYPPGFFVAPMTRLALTADAIAFVLLKPERLFTAPVPRQYRSAADVPPGLLEEWPIALVTESRDYAGTLGDGRITIVVNRVERVFRRLEESR